MNEVQRNIDRLSDHTEALRSRISVLTGIGEIQGENQTKAQRLNTVEKIVGLSTNVLLAAADTIMELGYQLESLKEALENHHENCHSDPEPVAAAPDCAVEPWQPIETLRPNQSAILCYRWKQSPGSHFIAEGYLSRDGVWCDQQGNPTGEEHTDPIYWMSFPKPPKVEPEPLKVDPELTLPIGRPNGTTTARYDDWYADGVKRGWINDFTADEVRKGSYVDDEH